MEMRTLRFPRNVGDQVVVWVEQHATAWRQDPPAWFTEQWRMALMRHAHLLPGDGASRVAAVICENAEPVEATRAVQCVDSALVV
jgi:hypothetical protein